MIKVGDKVKLDIVAIEVNGMSDSEEQKERFQYISNHPDEVYEIEFDYTPNSLSQYRLKHPFLAPTSFFEDELILVERGDKI